MHADVARANGWNGTGQVVAVIDSGVDRTNPYLAGDVVAEACYSTNAIGYTAGGCPNGRNVQTGTGAAAPCLYAGCAHGTHVAHTAAGAYGVAPGAKVIAVQIFHCERGEDHLLGERRPVRDELRLQPAHHISDRGSQHEHRRLQLVELLRQRRRAGRLGQQRPTSPGGSRPCGAPASCPSWRAATTTGSTPSPTRPASHMR